jgi:hypothetical protein
MTKVCPPGFWTKSSFRFGEGFSPHCTKQNPKRMFKIWPKFCPPGFWTKSSFRFGEGFSPHCTKQNPKRMFKIWPKFVLRVFKQKVHLDSVGGFVMLLSTSTLFGSFTTTLSIPNQMFSAKHPRSVPEYDDRRVVIYSWPHFIDITGSLLFQQQSEKVNVQEIVHELITDERNPKYFVSYKSHRAYPGI